MCKSATVPNLRVTQQRERVIWRESKKKVRECVREIKITAKFGTEWETEVKMVGEIQDDMMRGRESKNQNTT